MRYCSEKTEVVKKGERRLVFATTPWRRMRGLLGKRRFGGILVMVPCHDIHTVGMRMPIDVAFFGKDGRLLYSEREVQPGRRISCPGAYGVIERQASPSEDWPWEGDLLGLSVGPEKLINLW